MKNLFKIHFKTIQERGLIKKETTQIDFINKIKEEYKEIIQSYEDLGILESSELMDLICVCANAMQFYGFNLETELIKNIETQIERIKNQKL